MATGGQKANQAVVRRMAYGSFDYYKKLIYQQKHAIKSALALDLAKTIFRLDEIMAKVPNGATYLLNNVDKAQYFDLLQEKDQLATELRELMKLDHDI